MPSYPVGPMNCPFCHTTDTKVADSRLIAESNSIKRRRKCEACGKRFNTFEQFEINMPMVIKSDGRREGYNRQKIYDGITKACQKRPVATEQIENIIEYIQKTILELETKEISTREIGHMVMDNLRLLDPVAYVRFASVYRTFKDIEEFVQDLQMDKIVQKHGELSAN